MAPKRERVITIKEKLEAIRRRKNGMGLKHPYFFARTVLVRNGNVDEAVSLLNRVLGKEGIFDQWRHTRYYEKPTQTRRRVNFMKCKAIYNEDMDRKIKFIMRKNRVDPFPASH